MEATKLPHECECEEIVEEIVKDLENITNKDEDMKKHVQILESIHAVAKGQLEHRTEDFNANKKFGAELKAIHKFQGKWILIVMLLVYMSGMGLGAICYATSDTWLPYIGTALDGVKTATNIIK